MMIYREMWLAGGRGVAVAVRAPGSGRGVAVAVRATGGGQGSRGTSGRACSGLAAYGGLAGVREDAGEFGEAGAGGVACRDQDQVSDAAALEGRYPRRGGARVADYG